MSKWDGYVAKEIEMLWVHDGERIMGRGKWGGGLTALGDSEHLTKSVKFLSVKWSRKQISLSNKFL